MTDKKHMHIVRFEASNIKKLKAVEIVPNGPGVVTITGRNGQGKTSILDAIFMALGGRQAVCDQPIRQGQSKAHITVDLHDLVVTRKFTSGGTGSLTVTTKDGIPVKSPQGVLDSICSYVGFDPLAFVRMDPASQRNTLRKLVGLDFTQLDTDKAEAYAERTRVNRELDSAKYRLANYKFDPAAPQEAVSVTALMGQLSEVKKQGDQKLKELRQANQQKLEAMEQVHCKNQAVQEHLAEGEEVTAGLQRDIEQVDEMIKAMEEALAEKRTVRAALVQGLANHKNNVAMAKEAVKGLVWPNLDKVRRDNQSEEDALIVANQQAEEPIAEQIRGADAINTQVRSNALYRELKTQVDELARKTALLTTTIEHCESSKSRMLEEAKFPLKGLSFDDGGVLLDGVPFAQGSQAQQLRAATAIGLAMDPQVRVILIRDGSLLDAESMGYIAELAKNHDAQVWIERVSDKSPGAIVIEDGEIVEVCAKK
jgi:DNA repair exonuclease SbcCD ATPase subunit